MRLPSEYAAELRSTSDPVVRGRLTNELAGSARLLVVRSMRKICARHGAAEDAEDGAQELVPKLVERIVADRVPPRRGEEDSYLQRCARNAARDILEGKGLYKHRRYRALWPGDEGSTEPLTATEREAEHARMLGIVRDALAELHDTYREVIEAHDLRKLPLREIAEQWVEQGRASNLQKALQNVQAAHSRGMRALRERVRQRLEEAEG